MRDGVCFEIKKRRRERYAVRSDAGSIDKKRYPNQDKKPNRSPATAGSIRKGAASDMQLILGVPAKPPALRGKEEQRRERALIFIKNRSKRYKACSDVQKQAGVELPPVVV